MPTDIKLDPITNDLLVEGQDLRLVDKEDRVAQQIRIRLKSFLGEWFLDTSYGVPYYQQILIKAPDRAIIAGIFREKIITTPGVQELQAFALDYEEQTRQLTVTAQIKTIYGNVNLDQTL